MKPSLFHSIMQERAADFKGMELRVRGSYIDDGEEEEAIGWLGEGGGSCFSLSLIRTAPLVVGSACYTADKSVPGACVRV